MLGRRPCGTVRPPLISSTAKNWQTCSNDTNWAYRRLWWKRSRSMRRGLRPSDQGTKLPRAVVNAQDAFHTAPNQALEPTPTASAALSLLARLSAGVRVSAGTSRHSGEGCKSLTAQVEPTTLAPRHAGL